MFGQNILNVLSCCNPLRQNPLRKNLLGQNSFDKSIYIRVALFQQTYINKPHSLIVYCLVCIFKIYKGKLAKASKFQENVEKKVKRVKLHFHKSNNLIGCCILTDFELL